MSRSCVPIILSVLLVACGPGELEPDAAFECSNCERWNTPQEPFRILGNTWFVGTAGLTALLIETDEGLILVDAALPQSSPLIEANIRKLGFDPLNIKAILVSHAHFDHAGGINALQRLSDAIVYTSPDGAKVLQSGLLQEDDPQFLYGPDNTRFPASKKVTAIADGERVMVGDVVVEAIHTPGHTPGGVSWTWESCALGVCYDIVYADSLTAVSAEGFRFSDGPAANQLVESAGAISELDCDILLSPHPFFFGMKDKLENRDEGNPFINNVACMIYAETALDWLEQRLDSER
jgi:metallo-beta-lactamase class B